MTTVQPTSDYNRWLLTEAEMIQYLGFEPTPFKAISYGEMGTGKSSFWSTVYGPCLVLMFDAAPKAFPYLRGLQVETRYAQYGPENKLPPLRYDLAFYPDGTLWGRIEYYEEPDPDYPVCFETFMKYRASLLRWDLAQADMGFVPKFVICDSLTTMQFASFRYQEAVNQHYKDPRLWYGDMKRDMVRELMVRFAYAPYSVALLAHQETSKDEFGGGLIKGISAVGKFGSELPAQYSEVYRHYAQRTSLKEEYLMQTRHDGQYPARTAIQAPNPCLPHFTEIWKGFAQAHNARFGLPTTA